MGNTHKTFSLYFASENFATNISMRRQFIWTQRTTFYWKFVVNVHICCWHVWWEAKSTAYCIINWWECETNHDYFYSISQKKVFAEYFNELYLITQTCIWDECAVHKNFISKIQRRIRTVYWDEMKKLPSSTNHHRTHNSDISFR